MAGYRIVADLQGKEYHIGEVTYPNQAAALYRRALRPGGLKITNVRIIDPDGARIEPVELQQRIEAERKREDEEALKRRAKLNLNADPD
jgi:hypothetical protein